MCIKDNSLKKLFVGELPNSGKLDDVDWKEIEIHTVDISDKNQGSIEFSKPDDGLMVKTLADYVVNGNIIDEGSILRIKF